jgi:hypothetical protein
VNAVDWLWYDVYLCTLLEAGQLMPETARDPNAWDAVDIWKHCLAPWKQWLAGNWMLAAGNGKRLTRGRGYD